MNTRTKARNGLIAGALLSCCLTTIYFTHKLSLNSALNSLSQQTSLTADLFSANIESTVNRYSYLPKVLANRPSIFSALEQVNAESALQLSQELEQANRQANTLNIYLMARDGTTIASSNHAETNSFVGKNFAFRPYFRFAMNGNSGRYFALGTTSGKRGYYFSSPVRHPESRDVLGAMVVKVGLNQLEKSWKGKQPIALLTDQHNIVFSGNKNEWLFKSLSPLTPMAQAELQASRQYVGKSVQPIDQLSQVDLGHFQLLSSLANDSAGEYLHLKQRIAHSGWWLHTLTDTAPARISAWQNTLSATVLMALIVALALYYRQRRKTWDILRRSKTSLEEKVVARTADLTIANNRLLNEASEKETAYKALRDTQEKLLHSSRLATIGEMSTAITHELNQPITAISAYAENGQVYLAREQHAKTSENLNAIRDLAKRMAEITTTLKNHARKEDDNTQQVDISVAVQNTLATIKPQIDNLGAKVCNDLKECIIFETNQTRLEQILVNLLANACDAIADSPHKEISISSKAREGFIEIYVCDSGTGIPPHQLDEVFEPFFTTKGSSRGLGLGLSISQSIAKSLNGSMSVTNNPNSGACFCLHLPRPHPNV